MTGQNKTKTILVADDHEEFCELIVSILEHEFSDFKFVTAFSGKEAFAKFKEFKPCLALLDMHLSDMSGHNLALKMRAEAKDIKIMLVTAYSAHEIAETAAIVDSFVSKPIFRDALIKNVRSLL